MRKSFLLSAILFCSSLSAQVVTSSDYEGLTAKKTGTLSTSQSSGQGAEPKCKLTNISSARSLCIGDSVTLSLNYSVTNFDTIHLKWLSFDSSVLSDTVFYDFNMGPGNTKLTVKTPGTYYMDLYSINNSTGTSDCYYAWVVRSTLSVQIPDSTIFCPSGSVKLTAPPGNFSSYQWYKGDKILDGKNKSTYTAKATGNYYVQTTDSNNCILNSDRIHVTVYDVPQQLIVSGDTCTKGTLSIDAYKGNLTPDTIKWYRDNKLIKTIVNKGVVVAAGNGKGSGAKQLNQPYGIFLDTEKNLYVADYNNYRVMKYQPGHVSGQMVGDTLQLFGHPTDVAKDSDKVFIATTNSLAMFSSTIPLESLGSTNLWGISISNDHNPHVTYDGVYNSGGAALVFYKNSSGYYNYFNDAGDYYKGAGLTHLNYPNGIYVDSLYNLFITDNYVDSLNNNVGRILKWHTLADSGQLLAGRGSGNAPDQIWFAADVTFDKLGNMYVSDAINNRVQLWKPGDDHGITIINGFRPWGIQVDDNFNVYVADQTNNRILKFPSLLYNSIKADSSGSYNTVVTYPGGCTVTSNLFKVKKCKVSINNVLTTNLNKTVLNVAISPNPVQNILRIQLSNAFGNATVSIFDMTGKKLVIQQIIATGNNQLYFSTSLFAKGMYAAEVINNGKKLYLKFVKQ